MDFHSLTRKELQALSKKNKIPANMTNVAMADALAALDTVDGLEEHLVQTESETHFSPERPAATTPRVSRTSVRRKTVKEESDRTKLTTHTRRGTKESFSSESMQGKNALSDIAAAAITARSSTRRAVAEEVDRAKKELSQTPAVASSQRKAATRSMRGKVQNGQVKEEGKTEVKIYTTRRSTRLVEKKMEDLSLKGGEESTGESSRGKAVEADLENAFDEESEVLTGVEEKNEISGESKVILKEVPMESEISPVVLGKEGKDLAENGGDPQDIVSENKVKGHDHQGCDSYADDFEAHIEANRSALGEPNSNVDVKEVDSEMKWNTIHTSFEATNEGFDESKDVFMDVISSEADNNKGTPAEIDVPASPIFNSQSLDGELNLKKPQDVREDTNGLAASWASLEAKATTVVQDEYCGTEASDISSIHDFDELNDDILREVQKLNDADVKAECGLTNVNAAPQSLGTPAGFGNAGDSSLDDKNEDETKVIEIAYAVEANIDSMVLAEVEGSSNAQKKLYEENTEKIELSEVVDALEVNNGSKVLAEDEGTYIAETAQSDAFQVKAPEFSASEENTRQAAFKNKVEKIDQADAYESVDAANLHPIDMFVDNELVSEEFLYGSVNVQTSDLGSILSPGHTDNPVAIETSAEAKEAPPMEAVPASCKGYLISENTGFDQKTTSQLQSTDENAMVANRKELDHQFARLLLQSTPSNQSSSAQRSICVFDDKENNVSSTNKPELRAQKILVAESGTPLEKKSINCLRKMLKEKLQKEEKIRPALQSISGNCPAIGEVHSRDLSS